MPAPQLPPPEPVEPPGTFLFDDETMANVTDREQKYGDYLPERLPDQKRLIIIKFLAEQMPVRDIAAACGVSQGTVVRVADRYSPEIADVRAFLARKYRRICKQQADRLEQYPDSLPASSIAITIKMLSDVAELYDGKATSRVEVIEHVDLFSDFEAFLAAHANDGMEAKNGGPGIGCDGGKKALIAGPAADLGAGLGSGQVIDCDSSVLAPIPQATPADVTGYVTGPDPGSNAPGSQATPPGGGSAAPGPRVHAIENHSQNFWPNGSFTEEVEE